MPYNLLVSNENCGEHFPHMGINDSFQGASAFDVEDYSKAVNASLSPPQAPGLDLPHCSTQMNLGKGSQMTATHSERA